MFNLTDLNKIQQSEKGPLALCVIIGTKGSTPRKVGAKMLVTKEGKIFGSIGGGALEKKVIENAILVIKEKKTKTFRHDLLNQHNMCCGGTIDIYIEPIMKKNKLYIFGAGHTGQALAKYAIDMDFETIIIDDRKEYLDQISQPEVNKMPLDFNQALTLLPFDEQTFVAIMSYDHAIDRNILAYCIKKPHAYLGMIGSSRKVEMTKKMFSEAGIASEEELKSVDMPMGIDIKSESPEEIAISILAKLIETKYLKLK
ncbi:MAG: XdhC/CoxI family protein [Bacteroidetes bacterium]|nr:XdhC/CoxI family protein [Bacteroidota bacterium]